MSMKATRHTRKPPPSYHVRPKEWRITAYLKHAVESLLAKCTPSHLERHKAEAFALFAVVAVFRVDRPVILLAPDFVLIQNHKGTFTNNVM